MIAIVAALEAELAAVLDAARASGEVTRHTVARRGFLRGRLAGHDVLLAPLTFISIFGYQAQLAMFGAAGISVSDAQIVHVDQSLKFLQPIKAGDTLFFPPFTRGVWDIREKVRKLYVMV